MEYSISMVISAASSTNSSNMSATSSWLVLSMTMEQYIAVVFLFKKDRYCRPGHAMVIIFVLFALISYTQVFRFIVIEKDHGMCTAPQHYLHIYIAMHIYMYQLVLQFMLHACCNSYIL